MKLKFIFVNLSILNIILLLSTNSLGLAKEYDFETAGSKKYNEKLKIRLDEFNRNIPNLRKEIVKENDFQNYTINNFIVDYAIDTLRIEVIHTRMLELDDTNPGTVYALLQTSKDYLVLVNKYYNKLLLLYKKKDRVYIENSQKHWEQYIKADYKLEIKAFNEYDEFGSGKLGFLHEWYLDLIKARLDQLSRLIFQYHAKNEEM